MRHKFILCVVLVTIQSTAIAQRQIHHQSLYWLRYQIQIQFSPSVYWTNEADNRRFFGPDVENQLIFHSRLHYLKGPWDFGGGLTLSYAFAQIPENGYQHVTTEIRPVAEGTHDLKFNNISFQNRLRIDNRFFEVSEGESIFENSRYVLRLRYRIQAKAPIKRADGRIVVTLRIADEVMVNTAENFFDQNRIYVTGDIYVNKNFSVEMGYIYIYQQRFGTAAEYFSRNVLRLSLLHKINARNH